MNDYLHACLHCEVKRSRASCYLPEWQGLNFPTCDHIRPHLSIPASCQTSEVRQRAYSLRMPSLLVTVFALQLLIHLINTVGAATINALVRVSVKQCSEGAWTYSYRPGASIIPYQFRLRNSPRSNDDCRRSSGGWRRSWMQPVPKTSLQNGPSWIESTTRW